MNMSKTLQMFAIAGLSLVALSACGKSDNSTPVQLGGVGYNGNYGCTGPNCYNNGGGYNGYTTGSGWYGNANGSLPPLLSPGDSTGYRAFYPAIYIKAGQKVSVISTFKYGPWKPSFGNLTNGCGENNSASAGYIGNGNETLPINNSTIVTFTTEGWLRYGVDFYRSSICSTSMSYPRISIVP